MNIFLVVVIAYMLGNISPSYIMGKKYKNLDIRKHGSGNAGTTNALRVLGKKSAAIVFLVDLGKGLIAVQIGHLIAGYTGALTAAVFVVIGHVFPVFLRFKGGKGIATTIGALISLFPMVTLIATLFGVGVILRTRIVSLGSLLGIAVLPLVLIGAGQDRQGVITATILAVLVIFTHRENIKRLMNKNERRQSLNSLLVI